MKSGRLDAKAKVYTANPIRSEVFDKIAEMSGDAHLVFIGMKPPDIDEFIAKGQPYLEEYADYYRNLLDLTRHFPPTAFVMAAEDIKFNEIFA